MSPTPAAAPPSFDEADDQLKDWAGQVLKGVRVSFAAPAESSDAEQISFHLLEIAQDPPARTLRRAPLQVRLRYLVTTTAKEPSAAHRLLGELLFAALARTDVEVDEAPVPVDVWAALKVAPRAAFMLQVPFTRELPEVRGPLVTKPMVQRAVVGSALHGVVLGPQDFPLANATVEVPSLSLSAKCDPKGRFTFANVPSSPPVQLRVRAKGDVQTFTAPASLDGPMTIRFQLKEG